MEKSESDLAVLGKFILGLFLFVVLLFVVDHETHTGAAQDRNATSITISHLNIDQSRVDPPVWVLSGGNYYFCLAYNHADRSDIVPHATAKLGVVRQNDIGNVDCFDYYAPSVLGKRTTETIRFWLTPSYDTRLKTLTGVTTGDVRFTLFPE